MLVSESRWLKRYIEGIGRDDREGDEIMLSLGEDIEINES